MAVKIRLQRHGRKQRPFYFIVATDARERRDGKFIERLGDYNPLTIPATINLDREAAVKWIMNGAQPTNTVRKILTFKGVLYRKHLLRGVAKGAFTVEEADKRWADWLAAKEEKIQQRATNVASEKEQARRKRDETEKTKREAKASVKENVEVAEEVESPADEVAENVKAAVENVAAEQPVVEENPTVEEEAPQEESADNNEEKKDKILSEYIAVIKLQGAHALNGILKENVYILLFVNKDERMFALFQKKQGNYIPYLVENINFTGNHCIVKLADINNREEAGSLTGNELFLPEKEAHRFFDITEKIDFYGYLAYNNQELLGKLIELRQFPGQQIFIIENDDRGEILVPFTQDWIVEMNHEKRTIVFSLPEGLLDL